MGGGFMDTVDVQAFTVAVVVMTGAFLGLFYDLTAFIRRLIHARRLVTALFDLGFWLVSTGIVFAALLRTNYGDVRLFVLFGLGSGFFGYRFTVRPIVSAVLSRMERFGVRAGRRIGRARKRGLRACRTFKVKVKGFLSRICRRPRAGNSG